MPIEDAISLLGALTDSVYELEHAAGMALIDDAIPAAEALLADQPFDDTNYIRLQYVLANLWGHRYRLKTQVSIDYTWAWDSEEHTIELASLRKAMAHPRFNEMAPPIRCSILTNLGNCLNHVGRPTEALQYSEQVLALDPTFPMAQGNLGVGLYYYGMYLYDPGHKSVLFQFALQLLEQAIAGPLHSKECAAFQATKEAIHAFFGDSQTLPVFELKSFPTGKSKAERAYRDWCLKNRLFLNPLNDLGPYSVAARDILHCPPVSKPLSDEMTP